MSAKHVHILSIIFSVFFIGKGGAQTAEESFQFAQKQFEQENYSLALKEFQRVLFFDSTKLNPELYYSIAECYMTKGDFENAISGFDQAYYLYQDDSLKNDALFKRIHCLFVLKRFKIALIDLMGIQSKQEYWIKRKHFYLGMCYFASEDFDNSEDHFLLSIDKENIELKDEITGLFADRKRMNKPNPKVAKILSMILPGTGQMISGEILSGINSAILCDALLVGWLFTAYQYSFIDASISIFPWFYRYYEGGYKHAKTIAENRLQQNRSEVYKEILTKISSQF